MADMTDLFRHTSDERTISFADRLASSEMFQNLFQEGMGLVEETASYLDGAGRDDSRALARPASLAYSTESMRLTTRLMQIASWLLLQRAVNEGEMTITQAGSEKNKVQLEKIPTSADAETWSLLPSHLRDLVERSVRLQQRVQHLDAMLYKRRYAEQISFPHGDNTVAAQMNRLSSAFGSVGNFN